jgi:uncharacterized protein with HEPN domain
MDSSLTSNPPLPPMPSMPSDSAPPALYDIAYHIDLAASFIAGLEFAAFCADLRTIYAVMHCLEIISEASRRLKLQLKSEPQSVR